MVVEYVKTKGEAAFWNEYTKIETAIYKDLLANSKEAMKITIADFAKKYETSEEFIMGFVDGINDSLNNQYDLEALNSNDELVLDINLEKLFFNMLEAKAEYLYNLPQWDAIFSEEKRKEIQKAYRESTMVRNENKVGRNDACPCGSGKKYKNCCLRKETMSIPDRIREAVRERGYKEDIGDVLSSMYRYMERKQWWGACHATCAALYVCLTEIGYTPDLCIGEVLGQGLYFDHSWISLDDKMIDLAISMTLLGGAPASGVIVFGKDIKTGLPPILDYGVPGRGIEDQAKFVMELPFNQYMDSFPDEKDGLWGVVREVLGTDINIPSLREKYKDTKRVLVRHE